MRVWRDELFDMHFDLAAAGTVRVDAGHDSGNFLARGQFKRAGQAEEQIFDRPA